MKLYLSSYRLGSHPEALRELAGDRGRAGLIFNALDVYGKDRLRILSREIEDLASLGFQGQEPPGRLRGQAFAQGADKSVQYRSSIRRFHAEIIPLRWQGVKRIC